VREIFSFFILEMVGVLIVSITLNKSYHFNSRKNQEGPVHERLVYPKGLLHP
jgi:hypothetical protein